MSAGTYCNREVIVTDPETTITEAARLMRSHHVGDLVVVRKEGESIFPVGIITDRDIVVEVLAQEVPAEAVLVKDVMSRDLAMVKEDETLFSTLDLMKNQGVRRVLVVSDEGSLEGILSADDAIELIAEAMNSLVKLVSREIGREQHQHP